MKPPPPPPTRCGIRLHDLAPRRAARSLKLRYRRFVNCWPIQLGPDAADVTGQSRRAERRAPALRGPRSSLSRRAGALRSAVFLLIGAVASPALAQAPSPAAEKKIPAEV